MEQSSEQARYHFVKHDQSGFVECLPAMLISGEAEALELIGFCGENETDRLLIHAGNLTADFFDLHTRVAGNILLKLANYRITLAAVIPKDKIGNGHFSEMVMETNRGREFRVFDTRKEAVNWLTSI
ncbi:MAG: DUF4180 domain-containing protein [Anaerolineaceae bacterium]|nr:DUF4180 domain-containing protein [Anaerolineaceae bacterium]MBN2676949.1 DUF4180 domain-containing protein [Anaerolineaceae bacterium]